MLRPDVKMETVRWNRKIAGHFYHSKQGYVFMTPEARKMMHFTPLAIRATMRASFNALTANPDETMNVSTTRNTAKLKKMGEGPESHVYKLHMRIKNKKGLQDKQKTIALKFYKIKKDSTAPFLHKGIAQAATLMQVEKQTIEGIGMTMHVAPLTPLFVVSNGADHHIVAFKEVKNSVTLHEFMKTHLHAQTNAKLQAKLVYAWKKVHDTLVGQGLNGISEHNVIVEDYNFDDPKNLILNLRLMGSYHLSSGFVHHLHEIAQLHHPLKR